jgi:hypothetical protein
MINIQEEIIVLEASGKIFPADSAGQEENRLSMDHA